MTRVTDSQVGALKAQLAGAHDLHRSRLAGLDLNGQDAIGYTNLVQAAFFEIVDRHFASSTSMDDVVRYVADIRSRNEKAAESINPEAAERLILHCLGQGKVDDIDNRLKLKTKTFVLPLLVRDQEYNDQQLDEFMASARTIADNWMAKDEAEGRDR